jgi:hypothetical protein
MALLALLLCLNFVSPAAANPILIRPAAGLCSMLNLKRVTEIAQDHSGYDKFLHCAVSCMLAVKCPIAEVVSVGVMKEIKDMFGDGEADLRDIRANLWGINQVIRGHARTDRQCLQRCELRYP